MSSHAFEKLLKWMKPKESLYSKLRGDNASGRERFIVGLYRRLSEAYENLLPYGKEKICDFCLWGSPLLLAVGIVASLLIGNPFAALPLGVVLAMLPLMLMQQESASCREKTLAELEKALSMISGAYMREEGLDRAVRQHTSYMKAPVKEWFDSFVVQLTWVDADISGALADLAKKGRDPLLTEWCRQAGLAAEDRSLKDTLMPVVERMATRRRINMERRIGLIQPRREYYSMILMLLLSFPLILVLNADWRDMLLNSLAGKIGVALCLVGLCVSLFLLLRLTSMQGKSGKDKDARSGELREELSRFVSNFERYLLHDREPVRFVDNYLPFAGKGFTEEVRELAAEMKTGRMESAFLHWEEKEKEADEDGFIADISRGFSAVLAGDNTQIYWEILQNRIRDKEAEAQKLRLALLPGKIRGLSLILLACFMGLYCVVIVGTVIAKIAVMFG